MTLDLSSFECKTNFHGATECAILFEVLIGSASDIQLKLKFNVKVLLSFSFPCFFNSSYRCETIVVWR